MLSEQKPQDAALGVASDYSTQSPDRRQSARHGRERGLRVFLPAKALELAGIDPDGPPPAYTVQAVKEEPGRRRRSVLVRLYPG